MFTQPNTETRYISRPQTIYPYYNHPIATVYNQRTFVDDSNKRKKYYFNNNNVSSKNNGNNKPVTLSWNINAYVEVKQKSSLKRCFKKNSSTTPTINNINTNNSVSIPISNSNDDSIKHILKNVTGIVKSGQLCAIMGASGSGKTTLLNAINFRNPAKVTIEGDVKINGKTIDWKKITACSGYVQQEDIFISSLTVKEHLTFLAIMKLGRNTSEKDKQERVKQVMIQMNLTHVQNTVIGEGDRIRGISGGEKRRLSFASELLANLQLLFCDEPTSGLDSFMAQSIVESMKHLALQGKTVISTIHQPSSQIFELFDTLCLLSEGRVAYMGPIRNSYKFFKSIGNPCPSFYNPADHYINVLAVIPNHRDECLKKVNEICDEYEKSKYFKKIESSIEKTNLKNLNKKSETKNDQLNASIFTQLIWLLWRSNIVSLRDPRTGRTLVISSIVVAILLGLIYLQLKNDQHGVQDKIGVIFFLIMHNCFGFMLPLVNSFPSELRVFYRERKNRIYSVFPYYFAKQIAELPKYIVLPLLLSTITYWMADINNDPNVFIIVILIMLLASQCGVGFGLFVSVIAPSGETAATICGAVVFYFAIIGGFFIDNNSIPVYFIWFKYSSFFYYANEAINIQVWQNKNFIECTLQNITQDCPNPLCYSNGSQVLTKYAIEPSHMNRDVGLLFVLLFVPRVLGYIFLKLKSSRL